MKNLTRGRALLVSVPVDKIVAVVTSSSDYEMSRMIYVEDWPEYNEHTIIEGSHCSCYGFDDTEWEGVVYTSDEIKKLADGWQQGDHICFGLEGELAPLILRNLS